MMTSNAQTIPANVETPVTRRYVPTRTSNWTVAGATVLAMVAVAGIWLGIGYAWDLFSPTGTEAGNPNVHWPLNIRGLGGTLGWGLMLRRQRSILPQRIRQIDIPGSNLGVGVIIFLLISLLTGGWLHP